MTLPVVFTANGPSGYNLTKSLRFRSSASAYLNRTPASAGNRKTWTWSGWVKRGDISANYSRLLSVSTGNSGIQLQNNYTIRMYSSSPAVSVVTNAVLRDPSAWYHIVFQLDTTQATSTNRVKIYINGVLQTVSGTYPSLNDDLGINNNVANYLGSYDGGSEFFDGYMAEVNFIDGQALTPSSFGSTNALTGVWQPAKYTGTYGTNGFYLPFTNTTSTTTLGYDFSGNSNNWTTNNISLTAGSTYDSMTDVPTLTDATTANYAVFNPLQIITTGQVTVTNGNLTAANTSGGDSNIRGTIFASTGKWYAELTITTAGSNYPTVGIIEATEQSLSYLGATAKSYCYTGGGSKGNNNSFTSYGASYTTGDVIGVAYDATNATLTFYKNGTSQGTAFTGVTAGSYTFACSTLTGTININFGQRPFAYTPPTGFVALNTYNLPTSTIVKGNTVMDATLYTANQTVRNITNDAGFKPDLVWIKGRSNAWNNALFDSVRGVGKWLVSNTTGSEPSQDLNTLTSFNSNGFGLGDNSSGTAVNFATGQTFVGWQWQAGQGTTSSNTNGSITSTVSVNASAGFSVVTYTGNGTSGATVGHGLGVAPSMIIQKCRSNATDWNVYHSSLGATKVLYLDLTDNAFTSSVFWNNTAPTSSVFSLGNSAEVNGSTRTNVAYCWAEVAGFSKFGSYTGNGSTDGPFVYTGFRPKFIMIKQSSASGENWTMYDSARNTYNSTNSVLYADTSSAEFTSNSYVPIDLVSNGFKIRTDGAGRNASGSTYIYMAFAENPFKNALAR